MPKLICSGLAIRAARRYKNFYIEELVRAGAPFQINRANLWDLSEYRDDEIELTGNLQSKSGQPLSEEVIFEWD